MKKINWGLTRILEVLDEKSELRYTQLRTEAKLSDPVLSDYLKRLTSTGLVKKNERRYRITPKGRNEVARIHDNKLIANTDILLRSTIEPKFPDSLPRNIRVSIKDQMADLGLSRELGQEPDLLLEYMPPLGPVAVTLYGSKQLRQSLGLSLDGSIEMPESKATELINQPWSDLGKCLRQLVFSLLIGYFMELARSKRQPDFKKPIQFGMNVRLDVKDSQEVRHRIAGILFWYMMLPEDPDFPQWRLEFVTFMEKNLGVITGDEAECLRELIKEQKLTEFERECLELAMKHFTEGGCL